jgi:hypothetical protein
MNLKLAYVRISSCLFLLVKQFLDSVIKLQLLSPSAFTCTKYYRDHQSRKMRWAGHVARKGQLRNTYKILAGEPERNRPLGTPRKT